MFSAPLLWALTQAFMCPDGTERDVKIDYTHVQDFRWSLVEESHNISFYLSELARGMDETFNVNADGTKENRVKFSFVQAVDKTISTNKVCEQDLCSCEHYSVDSADFSDLGCPEEGRCSTLTDYVDRRYMKTDARVNLLDAALNVAQKFYNVPEYDESTGEYHFRITTLGADECVRESGRTTTDTGMQAKYWESMPADYREMWLEDPGLDEFGYVTEPNCDIRDYPTMSEFMRGMKASSTRLMTIYRDSKRNNKCQEVTTHTVGSFYETYMPGFAEEHEVPYVVTKTIGSSNNAIQSSVQRLLSDIVDVACQTTTTTTTIIPPSMPTTTTTTTTAATGDDECCCCC